MLTFEGERFQGTQAIVSKLTVLQLPTNCVQTHQLLVLDPVLGADMSILPSQQCSLVLSLWPLGP